MLSAYKWGGRNDGDHTTAADRTRKEVLRRMFRTAVPAWDPRYSSNLLTGFLGYAAMLQLNESELKWGFSTSPAMQGRASKMAQLSHSVAFRSDIALLSSCEFAGIMNVNSLISSFSDPSGKRTSFPLRVATWLFAVMLVCSTGGLSAQQAEQSANGVAWDVNGSWSVNPRGKLISTGDAIQPGSLLWPINGSANHSITVLLPDGQRILYECFLPQDCGRGFRVPSVYRRPDPFALEMLSRIHAVLAQRSQMAGVMGHQDAHLPRDETVAILDSSNRVSIAGLASALPNGYYTYDLRGLTHPNQHQSHLAIEKNGPSITLALPSSGLFDVTIADNLNTRRIDLLVAAADEKRGAHLLKSFRDAKALLEDWNGDYQGWPVHDFLRAYLESLVLGIPPSTARKQTVFANLDETNSRAVTAEPAFSPPPGVFGGDTAVQLGCDTPGGTIHYTVDGSQPFRSSPVYRAPIMVKGTALTIKAFATADGKGDSAVVTGIFRIGN